MAITVNGYIATPSHETPWSDEEWNSYRSIVQEVGNVIIGKTTYDVMKVVDEFKNIGNPFTVIVTSNELDTDSPNFVVAKSPQEALQILESKGYSTGLIGGGGILNSTFLKAGLVDEVYLDVEPFVFGKGIKLFADDDFKVKLELLGTKNLSKNTIQLHYNVVR